MNATLDTVMPVLPYVLDAVTGKKSRTYTRDDYRAFRKRVEKRRARRKANKRL